MSGPKFRFAIRVKPGARRTAVGGRWDGRLGPALVVAVTAPAVDGRANDAVCRALADALGVPRADLALVTGERGRDKLVAIREPPTGIETVVGRLTGDTRPGQRE